MPRHMHSSRASGYQLHWQSLPAVGVRREIKQEKVYLSGVRAKRLGEAGSALDLRRVFQERRRGDSLHGSREMSKICYIMQRR